MSIHQELVNKLKEVHPNIHVKKIDSGNYLDIHLPDVNTKKGTHLFFNTTKDQIKTGFYCRDNSFVDEASAKSGAIEKFAQGVRLKNNPAYDSVDDAVSAALTLIQALIDGEENTNKTTKPSPETKPIEKKKSPGAIKKKSVSVKKATSEKRNTLKTKVNPSLAEAEQSDGRGYPVVNTIKPASLDAETVNAYLDRWLQPSVFYSGKKGIHAFLPEWTEELIKDEVFPSFTNFQLADISENVRNNKVIPILDYSPDDLFQKAKQVWWVVPFCIWKETIASFVFIDKNGFHTLIFNDENNEFSLQLIFPWESVHNVEFETAFKNDPNVNRLSLHQESGSYLVFDEFVSFQKDAERGSYLSVVEAIWHARKGTIEASRDKSEWYEGAGGEGFKKFNNPVDLLTKTWLDVHRPDPKFFGYSKT